MRNYLNINGEAKFYSPMKLQAAKGYVYVSDMLRNSHRLVLALKSARHAGLEGQRIVILNQ